MTDLIGKRCILNSKGAAALRSLEQPHPSWDKATSNRWFHALTTIFRYGDTGRVETNEDDFGGLTVVFDKDPTTATGLDISWIDILPPLPPAPQPVGRRVMLNKYGADREYDIEYWSGICNILRYGDLGYDVSPPGEEFCKVYFDKAPNEEYWLPQEALQHV